MLGWIQDKLAKDEDRLTSLSRKMKRIRFQLEILDIVLTDTHSTIDLALFKERYRVNREKLDKLEDEHTDIEEVYLHLLAKYTKYNGGSLAISAKTLDTNVLEDDTGVSSNEDSEDSLGYESEESLEEGSEDGSEESSEDGSEESSEDGPD
ncbi:hypothetical protein FRX31_009033 [Thalictrum thalictroides]|uniref:Uncharacterized protein n=1 Tax=Thalictrum thalictroides TaxID=46969 RepID=A0A7J6WZ35_THATH|nr:hypothetical protein FRX31_009033 [Thalictrum thalictroides]